jgi:hypothetical protein
MDRRKVMKERSAGHQLGSPLPALLRATLQWSGQPGKKERRAEYAKAIAELERAPS